MADIIPHNNKRQVLKGSTSVLAEELLLAKGSDSWALIVRWSRRAGEYQTLFEPVDIANWYAKRIHEDEYGH